jgi:hypothetical protein
MSTFTCDYAGLRTVGGDFIKAMRTETNLDSLEAGLKCFNLHYLGCVHAHDHEEAGSVALFNIVNREYLNAEKRILGL